ncbi:lipoprotein chaperone [compost metagenome]
MLLKRILTAAAFVLAASTAMAETTARKPAELIQNLLSAKTAVYDFVQFSPRGDQISGVVKVQRPGNIRFEYEGKSPLLVVADGRSLGVNNRKLKTWNLYPLDKTPLKFLLDETFDSKRIKTVSSDVSGNITSIVLTDPAVFGDASIRLVFDNIDGTLRQWTVIDNTKQETTVILYNGRAAAEFGKADFVIPYSEIRNGTR